MPFVNNQGVKIHYEVEGKGPSIVLVHGLWMNGDSWRPYGYVSELAKDYQVILVDLRGHGQSDKPDDDNAYDMKTMTSDIIAIVDALNIQKAHYLGYSLGSCIGINGIARFYLSRFSSLVLGGFSACASDQNLNIQRSRSLLPIAQSAIEKGMEAYFPAFEELYGLKATQFTPAQLKPFLSLNPRAIYNVIKLTADSYSEADADELLPKIHIPCLIYAGESDAPFTGAKRMADKIPDALFLSFPGLNHSTAFIRSDLVLPYIRNFLAGARQIKI